MQVSPEIAQGNVPHSRKSGMRAVVACFVQSKICYENADEHVIPVMVGYTAAISKGFLNLVLLPVAGFLAEVNTSKFLSFLFFVFAYVGLEQ